MGKLSLNFTQCPFFLSSPFFLFRGEFLKRYWLLAFSFLICLFLCRTMWPVQVKATVNMTMIKNQNGIYKITDERVPVSEKSFIIDKIEFFRGGELIHSTFGSFEAYHNFFLDFETVMDVTDPGLFVFDVWSDDGFRLYIDDKLVSQYVSNREYQLTQAERFLSRGRHLIKLSYYQGSGPLGLNVLYQKKGQERGVNLGLSSRYARFDVTG